MSVVITGHSDDLIEIDGDVVEEFNVYGDPDDGHRLTFSDGTILRVDYEIPGVWRINPIVVASSTTLEIKYAPADDEDDYSDRAELTRASRPITWVKLNAGEQQR